VPTFTMPISPTGPVVQAVVTRPCTPNDESEAREVRIRAIIDTGAAMTFLDPSVLQALELEPVGSVPINTPSTGLRPHFANQYFVDIKIAGPGDPGTIERSYCARNVAVAESELFLVWGIQALIGRNALQNCLFSYNGVLGVFTLAY